MIWNFKGPQNLYWHSLPYETRMPFYDRSNSIKSFCCWHFAMRSLQLCLTFHEKELLSFLSGTRPLKLSVWFHFPSNKVKNFFKKTSKSFKWFLLQKNHESAIGNFGPFRPFSGPFPTHFSLSWTWRRGWKWSWIDVDKRPHFDFGNGHGQDDSIEKISAPLTT